MNNITIMMVTYNRLDLTKMTLESLKKTVDFPYNLVIIDNKSTDNTVDFLKSNVDCFLYENDENLGIARGRNQALFIADKLKTDWYVTIDNDVEFPGNWLKDSIEILKLNKKYGAIGVNYEPKQYPLINLNGIEAQVKNQGNLGTATMVFGSNLHKSIGFFKEYGKYGLEDSDFGWRARVFGFKLAYLKESGKHLGVGDYDTGDYRAFKTKAHDSKVSEFIKNCSLYANRKLPLYIPKNDSWVDEKKLKHYTNQKA